MIRQHGEGSFLIMLVIFFLMLGVVSCVDRATCHASWAKSGFATSWGPFQGCLVQLPDGRWIPENRVREIDPKDTKK